MRIAIIYIAVTHGPNLIDYSARYAATYGLFHPGYDHQTIVSCNGGRLSFEAEMLFSQIPNCTFYPRGNDDGWDISAYRDIANHTDAEILVCFGESIYFHRAGWLKRIMAERDFHGPGMYGFFSSYLVRPHLNTTAFVCDAALLRRSRLIYDKQTRYNFEHGENSFWRSVYLKGKAVKLVTWDGSYDFPFWRKPQNILWRGDQSNCLVFCNHTERYAAAPPETKRNWEAGADTLRAPAVQRGFAFAR